MKYYGIYRATIVDNNDPQQLKRLNVIVPAVGQTSIWALSCMPFMAMEQCATLKLGTSIWVEFEAGDPDSPVWMGVLSEQQSLNSET